MRHSPLCCCSASQLNAQGATRNLQVYTDKGIPRSERTVGVAGLNDALLFFSFFSPRATWEDTGGVKSIPSLGVLTGVRVV